MLFKNIKLLDENFQVRNNMFLATSGEKISYTGDKMPENPGDYGETIEGKGKFLMPAFYNTHCHVPMSLL